MEDEIHFLVSCPMYKEIREKLLPTLILQDNVTNDAEKFRQIMSDGDLKTTAKFISQSFDERDIRLDVFSTLNDLVSSTENLLTKNLDSRETQPKLSKKNGVEKAPLEFGSYRIKNFDLDGGKLILSHKENSCKDGNKNKNKNNYLSCKKECNKRYRVTKLSKVGLKMTLTKL